MSPCCPHCQHPVVPSADGLACQASIHSVVCASCGGTIALSGGAPTDITINGISLSELLARGLNTVHPQDQERWEPPTPEQLSLLLPQYQIESFLGRGGMGAVYKGRQERLQRAVAIKLLPNELADDPDFVNRFEREARTLAKLDHPGIIGVYDFGQTAEGHLYFVMEFVDGADLHRLICGEGIDPPRALEIISQVCDALQFAHSLGVVHRDIKPANILVTKDGRVKLADFGLARPLAADVDGRITMSRVIMGTPDYMAPEQKQGQGDHRVDLYALGVMLYEMLCGKPPQGAWQPPSQRVRVDVRLDQVVIKAMQEQPELRYQQAMQVKTDLDAIRSSITHEKPFSGDFNTKEDSGSSTSTFSSMQKRIIAIGVMGLVVVAGLLVWFEPLAMKAWHEHRENRSSSRVSPTSAAAAPLYHKLISTTFDQTTPFSINKNSYWETALVDGLYTIKRTDSGSLWFTAQGSEAGSSTLIRISSRISNQGVYGKVASRAAWSLIFRSNDLGSYKVEVRGDGFWRLYFSRFFNSAEGAYLRSECETVSPWSSSPAVRPAGEFNHLSVIAKGHQITVICNDTTLGVFEHQGSMSGIHKLLFCSAGDALLECDDFELLESING